MWGGYRFRDIYDFYLAPIAMPNIAGIVFRCQDGYRTSLPLDDLLADEVMLADELNGEPLSAKHGQPLRLVAPAHYGYKNPKHLKAIELRTEISSFQPVGPKFMAHPRARVSQEERGVAISGKILRFLYRPLIKPTIRQFERGMQAKQ